MAGMLRAAVVLTVIGCSFAQTTTPAPVKVKVDVESTLTQKAIVSAKVVTVANTLNFKVGRSISIGLAGFLEDRIITTIGINTLAFATPLKFEHGVGSPVKMHSVPLAAPQQEGPCKLTIPKACHLPFSYKGISYNTCTGVDAMTTLWCSADSVYSGRWHVCKDPCKGKWPVKKIVGTVIASSIAATGVGLTAAAIANDVRNGHFNPFHGMQKTKEKFTATSTNGPPHVIVPARNGHPAIMGQVVQVTPAPATQARRLAQPLRYAVGSNMELDAAPASGSWVVFALIAVFIFMAAGIYSLWSTRVGKKSSRHGVVAPDQLHLESSQA